MSDQEAVSVTVLVCAAVFAPSASCVSEAGLFLNVNVKRMRQIHGRCKNSLRLVSLARHRCVTPSCVDPACRHPSTTCRTHTLSLKCAFAAKWFHVDEHRSLFVTVKLIMREPEASSIRSCLHFAFSWDLFRLVPSCPAMWFRRECQVIFFVLAYL